MEVIIHGKPNSVGSKSTGGIDSLLKERIEDNFFRNMSLFEGKESMYVDAWKWKGKWYSVYTYLLYEGIRDTAKRPSYFALSLVLPNQYCCLVSEVYKLLKEVTTSVVIGGFIGKDGNYLRNTFQDDSLFNSVVNEINKKFDNLVENFDSEFIPQAEFTGTVKYHIIDCDSKAFVHSLKQYGRVIVSESAPTKDSLVASNEHAVQELTQVKVTMQEKDETIKKLKEQLERLSGSMSSSGKAKDDEIKKLKKEIEDLKDEKESLIEEQDKICEGWKGVEDALTRFPLMDKKMSEKPVVQDEKNLVSKYLPFVPFLNTFLIVVLAFISISVVRNTGYASTEDEDHVAQVEQYKEENEVLQGKINELTIEKSNLEKALEELSKNVEQPKADLQQSTMDVDCNFVAFNQSKKTNLKNNDMVNVGDTIVVSFNSKQGYNIHYVGVSKINDSTLVVNGVDSVIVSYRSDNLRNVNPQNKINLVIKK